MKTVLILSLLCGLVLTTNQISFVILGASGDLAKRKIYPSLLRLYIDGELPEKFNVIGYARSSLTDEDVKAKIEPFIDEQDKDSPFFDHLKYIQGSYDKSSDFENLNKKLLEIEGDQPSNRIFYLSLPPNVTADPSKGFNRIVIEKPFGRDLKTFHSLSKSLNSSFTDEETYRIDHFVGKEVVQNIYATRFANPTFSRAWDSESIENIQIIFKEKIDLEGRGGYFDEYGMIRDVMQNHLMQILAMVTMDEPSSNSNIVQEKIKLLKRVKLSEQDVVAAQYQGYNTDSSVKKGTTTETFGAIVAHVENDRWKNVPIYMKAGKALDEKVLQVIVKFKSTSTLFADAPGQELVFRIQPQESIYLNTVSKVAGISNKLNKVLMKHSYEKDLPDAYVRLLRDVMGGDKTNFITEEEINVCWQVFDNLLHNLDNVKGTIAQYEKGSSGPSEEIALANKYNIDLLVRQRADC
ncbi:glucose-6-phosphate 1-dehydrogenase [Acrasis kona]|uniref:Glucose-6-phosphate 1-dehydrogenase n=1 Tax=Acrasis kona TaxID=1008807 RepID=A0AAW2ZPJ8_9EUKA